MRYYNLIPTASSISFYFLPFPPWSKTSFLPTTLMNQEFHQAVTEVQRISMDFWNKIPNTQHNHCLKEWLNLNVSSLFVFLGLMIKAMFKSIEATESNSTLQLVPYKGGLRFHPSVNLSILKFLWFEQTFKKWSYGTSLWDEENEEVISTQKGKTDNEIMRFCQAFMSELFRHIGADTDVPAGDIGVGAREIGYMVGMYKKLNNTRDGTFTGKWLTYWGSLIRTEATGYGVVYFLDQMLQHNNETLKGKKVIVSGSWNVAQYAIEKAMQLGATVISASDSDGTIEVTNWFTPELLAELLELKNVKRGRLEERNNKPGIVYHTDKTPWHLKADIALPCATQNELDLDDAKQLVINWITYVVEWANMPTSLEATHYFQDQWIYFAPGKAANAGGVATSWLEMSQNSLRLSRTREEVDARLHEIMKNIHATCVKRWTEGNKVNYVKWANIGGFVKVAEAMLAQGVV